MDNNQLTHWGVKGMRWGVRKDRIGSSGGSKKRSRQSDDHVEVSKLRKKKISEMSNAELQRVNNRTQLEQNYKRLHPSSVKKGIAVVAASAATMNTLLNLYNNSDKIVKAGSKVSNKIINAAGDMVMKDLAKGLR